MVAEGRSDGARPGGRVLGAYAAKQCPARTQYDVLRPVDPAPTPAFIAGLGRAGIAFEADVAGRLAEDGAVAVPSDRSDQAARVAATLAAMEEGALLIHGGRLPVDLDGRRIAEPDLLVRAGEAPVDGRWRYRAVDVKHHSILIEEGGAPVVVWTLADLAAPTSAPDLATHGATRVGRRDATARNDQLQLAHYQRTLEACGHAVDGPVWGGVLGREEQVAWFALDRDPGGERDSPLAAYDRRFAERLAIADAAAAHLEDPTQPLLVEPVLIPECEGCPWRTHCLPLLHERGDVSLLPRVGTNEYRAFRAQGIHTIADLAALPDTSAVEGIGDGPLDGLVSAARARLGASPAYRRHGVRQVDVRRADVELDVDMENADEVYLWGVLVTDRTADGAGAAVAAPGYHPFVSFEPGLETEGATALFLRFWHWLRDVEARCGEAGLTFAAYCWAGPAAEDRWMRTYATAAGVLEEVEWFIAGPTWVDLIQPFRSELVTGYGASLKTVAPMAGFAWRDDDPGGGQSTIWYATAVDPTASEAERQAAQERLLAYNEDDVLATLAVREWLDASAPFPSIADA